MDTQFENNNQTREESDRDQDSDQSNQVSQSNQEEKTTRKHENKKNILILEAIFKQGNIKVSKAYDAARKSHFFSTQEGTTICKLLQSGHLSDVSKNNTGIYVETQYKLLADHHVCVNTDHHVCDNTNSKKPKTKQRGKTGTDPYTGHVMDNSVVVHASNTCLYDKIITPLPQIKQTITQLQYWEKTVEKPSSNTITFTFRNGSNYHAINLYTREGGNITITGPPTDRPIFLAYALMIGDIPPELLINDLNTTIQQINQLVVNAMAVTQRPHITITRLIDCDTTITVCARPLTNHPEDSFISHMSLLMGSMFNNIHEDTNQISCNIHTGSITISKTNATTIHTTGNRFIDGVALVMAYTFGTRRRVQRTPQGNELNTITTQKKNKKIQPKKSPNNPNLTKLPKLIVPLPGYEHKFNQPSQHPITTLIQNTHKQPPLYDIPSLQISNFPNTNFNNNFTQVIPNNLQVQFNEPFASNDDDYESMQQVSTHNSLIEALQQTVKNSSIAFSELKIQTNNDLSNLENKLNNELEKKMKIMIDSAVLKFMNSSALRSTIDTAITQKTSQHLTADEVTTIITNTNKNLNQTTFIKNENDSYQTYNNDGQQQHNREGKNNNNHNSLQHNHNNSNTNYTPQNNNKPNTGNNRNMSSNSSSYNNNNQHETYSNNSQNNNNHNNNRGHDMTQPKRHRTDSQNGTDNKNKLWATYQTNKIIKHINKDATSIPASYRMKHEVAVESLILDLTIAFKCDMSENNRSALKSLIHSESNSCFSNIYSSCTVDSLYGATLLLVFRYITLVHGSITSSTPNIDDDTAQKCASIIQQIFIQKKFDLTH